MARQRMNKLVFSCGISCSTLHLWDNGSLVMVDNLLDVFFFCNLIQRYFVENFCIHVLSEVVLFFGCVCPVLVSYKEFGNVLALIFYGVFYDVISLMV